MPTAQHPVYSIRFLQQGESRAWLGTSQVWIDPTNGHVVSVYDPLTAPLTNKIFDAAFVLHNGEYVGLTGQILTFLAGLALPTLYVTGMIAWFRKRRRRIAARGA